MVYLGNKQVSFIVFEIAPKDCISDFPIEYESYSICCKELLPTVVDMMVVYIEFARSGPF